MLEYREALESSLSRYTATPLGIYEENGRVYSSQLPSITACSPASGRKVAVTRCVL
jgi:type IV secretion system protein VirB4